LGENSSTLDGLRLSKLRQNYEGTVLFALVDMTYAEILQLTTKK
jgi:hypothetical protein